MPSRRRAVARALSRELPAKSTVPLTRPLPVSPDTAFNRVVFPAPLGPIMARTSSCRSDTEASSSAFSPPYATDTCSRRSTTAAFTRGAAGRLPRREVDGRVRLRGAWTPVAATPAAAPTAGAR